MSTLGDDRRLRAAGWGLLALALGALWVGWNEFWFLTDDAYITFRYASNRQLGFGYVWNAPPFRPVEGYSNFLWLVLLDGVWTLLRIEPPSAANALSLACAALSVVRVWTWALHLGAADEPALTKLARATVALAVTLSNRTFLAWTSSGLETALFNLLQLLWVETLWRTPTLRFGHPRFAWAALFASASALTRPDGLLAWAACWALAWWPGGERGRSRGAQVAALGALLLVPAHVLWRRATYGEWLPNTYYAKHVAPWPEMGVRYLASFVLEYGYWLVALWALLWAAWRWRPALRTLVAGASVGRVAAAGALVAHAGYYVLRVGGDHFEYRVLSQWVPLLALASTWLIFELGRPWWARLALVGALAWASLPLPWTHYQLTRGLLDRDRTLGLKVPVAPAVGLTLGPAAGWFDTLQAQLIEHSVGLRHQEHRVFGEEQRRFFSIRRPVDAQDKGIPVMAWNTIGVPSWVLPNVAFIDLLGLNDYVVARNPVPPDANRQMAHDRMAPKGYADCFKPNAAIAAGTGLPFLHPRDGALTAEDVLRCERTWAEKQGLRAP